MLVVLYKEHKRAAAVHRENADLQPCDDFGAELWCKQDH